MGPTWGRQDPGGPHVGHMEHVIWVNSKIGHQDSSAGNGRQGDIPYSYNFSLCKIFLNKVLIYIHLYIGDFEFLLVNVLVISTIPKH